MSLQDISQDLINTTTDILEARRNPELNPKIGPYTQLKKYVDDPSIFISFTEIDKIGINPQSNYNTPLGIYTYPLQAAWENYKIDNLFQRRLRLRESTSRLSNSQIAKIEQEAIQDAFPFATKHPYIQVLTSKRPLTVLQDFKQIDIIRYNTKRVWEIIENSKATDKEKENAIKGFHNLLNQIITRSASPRVNTPGGLFWWLTLNCCDPSRKTRHIAQFIQNHYNSKNTMRVWNYFLRDLGYDGFIDKGDSIIHENEPTQAVFLTRKAFTLVDQIMNKPEVLSKKKEKLYYWMNDNEISDDAQYKYNEKDDTYIWYGGTFFGGTWRNGSWEKGTWRKGTWQFGTWRDGTWHDGSFENGTWLGGTWLGGDWLGGTWLKGKIFSHKFNKLLQSRISPDKFYKAESDANTLEELLERV